MGKAPENGDRRRRLGRATLEPTAMVSSCAAWSSGEQTKVVQLLIVSVCWLFLQIDGGSPGTTAVLFTLAVFLVPRRKRHVTRRPSEPLWPDALSSAENGNNAGSLEITANLLRTELEADIGRGASGVQSRTPLTSTRGMTAAPATPKTPAGDAPTTCFEEALTRLAGAASTCGSEPLVYVRRADVAAVVDALIDVARTRTPVAPTVTSPAFARLTLVRRSGRRDPGGRRRACSPMSRAGRAPLACHRGGSNGGGGGDGSGRRGVSASPSCPRGAPQAATVGRALFQDTNVMTPSRDVTRASPASTKVTFRAPSPSTGSLSGEGDASVRRTRDGQDGMQHWLLQRRRSPLPAVSSRARGMMPVALAKNIEPSRRAAGDGGGDSLSTSETRKRLEPPTLIAATARDGASVATCPTASDKKKIQCVPVKGEETDFDDFWSSGWG